MTNRDADITTLFPMARDHITGYSRAAVEEPARLIKPLVESGSLRLADFVCTASHPSWESENVTGPLAHLVFPSTPVGITLPGVGRQIQDPNWVVYYPPGQPYRRDVLHPAGDVCSYVEMSPQLLEDLAGRPVTARVLAAGRARLSAPGWAAYQVVVTRARRGAVSPDEVLDALVNKVLDAADVTPDPTRAPGGGAEPSRTRARDTVDTVNAACQRLGVALAEGLKLDELAASVRMSPFQLCRLFRQRTGTTIHAYREQLRLRAAFALLADPDAQLTEIAQKTGFFSHSHLTTRFGRSFGMSPSTARDMLQSRITI